MLSTADYRAALDVVRTVHAGPDPTAAVVLDGLQRLVGADSVAVTVIDHRRSRFLRAAVQRPELDLTRDPVLQRHLGRHPAFAAFRSRRVQEGGLLAVSDVAGAQALRNDPLFRDCYQRVGVRDQLVGFVHVGASEGAVITFNRSWRGVSARDRDAASLVLPHLTQAWARQRELRGLRQATRLLTEQAETLDAAVTRLSGLTSREHEVAELVTHGLTDRRIARALGVSERTVHKHLGNIYRKLGLASRSDLLVLVHRQAIGRPAADQVLDD